MSVNILYPIGSFYPDQSGGPSSTLYWISKAITKKGINVNVVTTTKGLNGKFQSNKWVEVDGIETMYCSGVNRLFNRRMIWQSIKSIRNADIIQLSSIFYPPNILFCICCILLRKPIIWSPRGELSPIFRNNNIYKRIYQKIIKLFSHKIIFHCTADSEKKEILDVFGAESKIILVPNYMEILNPKEISQERILLSLGRIRQQKALDKLIIALSLSEKFLNSDFKLLIVGDDKAEAAVDYVKYLKSLIQKYKLQDRVIFEGPSYGDKKFEYYARAYCTFLVSYSENFGNVVIESLSQGTPVIASFGTPWKLLSDENIGKYIPNDPHSIAKSIDQILSLDPKDYQEMRVRCSNICKEKFSIEAHIDEWIDIYEKIVKS